MAINVQMPAVRADYRFSQSELRDCVHMTSSEAMAPRFSFSKADARRLRDELNAMDLGDGNHVDVEPAAMALFDDSPPLVLH